MYVCIYVFTKTNNNVKKIRHYFKRMNPTQEQTDLYVASLTPDEKNALNVAQTNISDIFRLIHTVGYKEFIAKQQGVFK